MNIIHFSKIDSTNLYIKNNYKILENLTFVDADYQTNGKGRGKRIWESNKGENLLFSLLLSDKKIIEKNTIISLFSAVTILKFLKKLGLKNIEFKWPNDVYVNGKKICGILLEGISESENLKAIILGIGLNINQDSFDGKYNVEPTSIKKELGCDFDINSLKKDLYEFFISELSKINRKEIIRFCNKYNYLKNKEKEFILNGKSQKVLCKKISLEGKIKAKLNKKTVLISSGEIQ